MPKPKILCIDFDGVLHSYTSGWQGASDIPDPPVDGAIEWIGSLVVSHDRFGNNHFRVCVYSSRSKHSGGIKAMRQWLLDHGLSYKMVEAVDFPKMKPAAFLTIDDRAHCFDGNFPSIETIRTFKTWQQTA